MTKVDEAFNDLKAGTDHEVLKKRFSSGTLSRGYALFLDWAKERRKQVRSSINRLEEKEKELQISVEMLEKDAKEQTRVAGVMKKQISSLEAHEQEVRKNVSEYKKRLESLENSLNELITKGVTEDAITQINSMEFEDDDELLKRISTLKGYTRLKNDVSKLETEYTRLDLLIRDREEFLKNLNEEIISKENELDEAKRSQWFFQEAVEIMVEFRKAGYQKDTLLSLKNALKGLEIKGDPDTSAKRLLDGLRSYKSLHSLESTLRIKRQEYSEIKSELEKAKGSLSAFQESIVKELKGTEKEFTKNIKSLYKKYIEEMADLKKVYMHEAKTLFEEEEQLLSNYNTKAINSLGSVGMAYSKQMSGLKAAFEKGVSSMISNQKKVMKDNQPKKNSAKRAINKPSSARRHAVS
jgi:chromosome segregation ATPase